MNSPAIKRIKKLKHSEWDINQDISIEEIVRAISSIPNFKASGPDEIPIEFYKALVPDVSSNDSDDTDSPTPSGLSCLHTLLNRIWNGEFPSCWNNASHCLNS